MEIRTFGQLLRRCREDAGKTLKDAAASLGFSAVYLSDIERGRRNPPAAEAIKKIAAFIGCSASQLLDQADLDRKRVEIPLTSAATSNEAALALARRWTDLTEDQLQHIMNILEGGQNKPL
jgi:transcriptional regulator with XRE-family HTH domain